jgi:hypothetical protein
MPKPAGLKLGT